MNEQFIKDVAKNISQEPVNQRLSPGSPRRYEPEGGLKKHRERIHRESKHADDWKSLPFTFSKPSKPRGRSTYIRCDNCGHISSGTVFTVGIICKECNKFSSVTEVSFDGEG